MLGVVSGFLSESGLKGFFESDIFCARVGLFYTKRYKQGDFRVNERSKSSNYCPSSYGVDRRSCSFVYSLRHARN